MSGTLIGGIKASITNKKRYGKEFYSNIGRIGGKRTGMKGFALNRELARKAGKKGGTISRRGKAKNSQAKDK